MSWGAHTQVVPGSQRVWWLLQRHGAGPAKTYSPGGMGNDVYAFTAEA